MKLLNTMRMLNNTGDDDYINQERFFYIRSLLNGSNISLSVIQSCVQSHRPANISLV